MPFRLFFSQQYTRSIATLVAAVCCIGPGANALESNKYKRAEWLPKWSDADRDCQNTRHELLVRFSLAPITYTDTRHCQVKGGLWMDPYTGQFFELASDLDVEHIVPLKWAHERGGAEWSRERKRAFAEDPDNLWLVDDGRNQSKGHKGPDEWMPPYGPVRTYYLRRFLGVAEKYGLQVRPNESQLILAMLADSRKG
ncbi:HNH endonuclease family protein [Microbulbifer agarilyticus]|nr:HNH endonuclease family protein [Microbulbifer agarilyticus]